MSKNSTSTAAKIASLDSDVGNLRHDFDGLRDDFNLLAENVSKGFKELRESINANTKTDWGKLVGFAGIIMGIFGMWMSQYNSDLGRIERNQNEMIARERGALLDSHEHETVQGHLGMQIRVGALEEEASDIKKSHEHDLENLDTVLQREMRLLDEETTARMEGISSRIDSETDILERQVLESRDDISELFQSVKGLEVLLDEVSKDVDDIAAEQRRRSTAGQWKE